MISTLPGLPTVAIRLFPTRTRGSWNRLVRLSPRPNKRGPGFWPAATPALQSPYGEWHARELEHLVRYLGFTPEEALRCTTKTNAEVGLLRSGASVGTLVSGQLADFIVIDGDPLQDITVLQ